MKSALLLKSHVLKAAVVVLLIYIFICMTSPTLLPRNLRFPAQCKAASGESKLFRDNHSKYNISSKVVYKYREQIKRGYEYFNEHSWIPRGLSENLHEDAMQLLTDASELLNKHNITYVLCHGTLIGSYFFHDVIPWDDDLDIMIPFKDVNKVRAMLRKPEISSIFTATSYLDDKDIYSEKYIPFDVDISRPSVCGFKEDLGLQNAPCFHKFHLFKTDAPKTTRRSLGYPFIDVKFYSENSTHVFNLDLNDGVPLKRDVFYPLHYRPFFNSWQPVPAKPGEVLTARFGGFKCASKWYSHLSQYIAFGNEVDCSEIQSCYPYVKRLPALQKGGKKQTCLTNTTVEQLVIAGRVLYETEVPEEFQIQDTFEM